MKKTRYIFTASLIIFIAYCTLDAGYSYWTDQATVSGKAIYNHYIDVVKIEEIIVKEELSEQNDSDTKKENETDPSKPKGTEKEKPKDEKSDQISDNNKDPDEIEYDEGNDDPIDKQKNDITDNNKEDNNKEENNEDDNKDNNITDKRTDNISEIEVALEDRDEEVQESITIIVEEDKVIDGKIGDDNPIEYDLPDRDIEDGDTEEEDLLNIDSNEIINGIGEDTSEKRADENKLTLENSIDNNFEQNSEEIQVVDNIAAINGKDEYTSVSE